MVNKILSIAMIILIVRAKDYDYMNPPIPKVQPKVESKYFGDFISAIKHLLIGVGISISIILVCKMFTYIGLPENVASVIAAFTILIIPISMAVWLFKIIKRDWKNMIAALRGK